MGNNTLNQHTILPDASTKAESNTGKRQSTNKRTSLRNLHLGESSSSQRLFRRLPKTRLTFTPAFSRLTELQFQPRIEPNCMGSPVSTPPTQLMRTAFECCFFMSVYLSYLHFSPAIEAFFPSLASLRSAGRIRCIWIITSHFHHIGLVIKGL